MRKKSQSSVKKLKNNTPAFPILFYFFSSYSLTDVLTIDQQVLKLITKLMISRNTLPNNARKPYY